jgi:hypothetical protein
MNGETGMSQKDEREKLADELEEAAHFLDVSPIGADEVQLVRTSSRGFWRDNANRMRRAAALLRSPRLSGEAEIEKAQPSDGGWFRKKPVVIQAVQFDGSVPYPEGVKGRYIDPMGGAHDGQEHVKGMVLDMDFKAVIDTLEGTMRVNVGDWIITGIKGEKYPCKPDIFEATYELVSD